MVATFNNRDLPGLQDLLHEDAEFRSKLASVDGVVYSGKDGVAEYLSDIESFFDEWHLEDTEYIEAGDDGVVLFYRVRGTGRGSGVPVDFQLAMYWQMRDGCAWRGEVFADRRLALQAAGLAGDDA